MSNPGTQIMNDPALRADHPRRCQGLRRKRHWADPNVPERCSQYALKDSNFCKFHGGHQARNVALRKNFKARSSFLTGLPKGLAKRINRASLDPELTSLRSHIALVDDRILQILDKLPTKESGQAWQALQEDHGELEANVAALKRALPEEQIPALADAVKHIDRVVESMFKNFRRTRAEREVWSEALGHFEQRRRMSETEVKRENFLQSNLTSRQTMTLFASITAILMEELKGLPDIRSRVGARLSTLLINEPGGRVLPSKTREDTAEDAPYEVLPREAAAESGSSAEVTSAAPTA